MATVDGFIAENRFGLGSRPGELDSINRSPRAWISSQISNPFDVPPELSGLQSSVEILEKIHSARIKGPETLRALAREELRPLYDQRSGCTHTCDG